MDAVFGILVPDTSKELVQCYFLTIFVFLAVNVLWDIFSNKTPDFHFLDITGKSSVIAGSTTFVSSWLVLASMLNPGTSELIDTTFVPLIIAGSAGILWGLSALCPYPIEVIRNASVPQNSTSEPTSSQ